MAKDRIVCRKMANDKSSAYNDWFMANFQLAGQYIIISGIALFTSAMISLAWYQTRTVTRLIQVRTRKISQAGGQSGDAVNSIRMITGWHLIRGENPKGRALKPEEIRIRMLKG